MGYLEFMEGKERKEQEEERWKEQLFLHRPEVYDHFYGNEAYEQIEEEAEFHVPDVDEVQELLSQWRASQ